MATGKRITSLAELSAVPEPDDYSVIIDTSDPTHGINGTTKRVSRQNYLGYTEYVALLTQAGTDAPTATVIKNDTGATVVWSRTGVGAYRGTFSSAVLTANKTVVMVITNFSFSLFGGNVSSTSLVDIFTQASSLAVSAQDGYLLDTPVIIRIYV